MVWIWLAQMVLYLAVFIFIMEGHRYVFGKPRSSGNSPARSLSRGLSRTLTRGGSFASCNSVDGNRELYETEALLDLGSGPSLPAIPEVRLEDIVLSRWAAAPEVPALWLEGDAKPRTAGELRAHSLACAARLLENGPNAVGDIVPVLAIMDDGPEFVVGIMGVMIAGAAFCPMDVQHPPERVRCMLETTAASVAVVSHRARDLVVARFGWQGRLVDVDCTRAPAPSALPRPATFKGVDDPIYVIFTSGSTGKPKGTVLSHRALLSHIPYYTERFGLTGDPGLTHRILRTTAVTFDMCYSQIFGALYSGATLVWPKTQLMKDPLEMRRVCDTYGVSFLMMVPSALSLFLELSAFPSCVRHVGSGGEALHFEVAKAFFTDRYVDRSCLAMLHNRYGPTEAAINAAIKVMDKAPSSRSTRTVPIGRPSAHRRMFVCAPAEDQDEESASDTMTLLEHGASGEIYIAGPCLADGYLNSPEITHKAFRMCSAFVDSSGRVLQSFAEEGGLRLYRTGDLMRWHRNELEFLGRVDSQVKLRGFRIELGEIEARLRAVPGVLEAQVLLRNDFPDRVSRLVAFVSPPELAAAESHNSGGAFGAREVAARLRQDLPEYMVPERLIGVARDDWPRTTTGKIDRKELVKIDITDAVVMEATASAGGAEPTAPKQAVDSLGFVRNLHRKERNVDIALDNLRAGIIVLVIANHWTGYTWPNIQGWQAFLQRFVNAEHTYALCLLSGIDDSRNVDPFRFTAREPVFMLLYFVGLVSFSATFPFWYFPMFVFVKAYTVAAHKLGVSPWVSCLLFMFGYTLLPVLGLQIQTYDDREAAAAAGCFFLDTIFPWWQPFFTWLLGLYSFNQPFICFSIAPFYWVGVYCGRAILDKFQHFANAAKARLPASDTWFGSSTCLVVRGVAIAASFFAYDGLVRMVEAPKHSCTEYRGNDTHYFMNTLHGFKASMSYLLLGGVSYAPLFVLILLVAGSCHWKTAGRCVIGGYFMHVFFPYVWWMRQPYSLDAYTNLWRWFEVQAPDGFVGQTLVAIVQSLFVLVFPTIFLCVIGPLYMLGFVPLMRSLNDRASVFTTTATAVGLLVFVCIHACLSPSLTSLGLHDWVHDALFDILHPMIAGAFMALLFAIVPTAIAWAAALAATAALPRLQRCMPRRASEKCGGGGAASDDCDVSATVSV
eukprot:TRINITY_DN4077_c0_g4_i1.p1 TRINITY_DN4077_c0_g4~~TRINITY_DN4077_c0_g4_i1.p1  ORF type:complete len:1250 (-),score=179.76 TRINITY_DN4077_c0_g4_i1:238-3762(-)